VYEPGTILTLKQPKDPDAETGAPFPYNDVVVVGPSPVNHALLAGAQWQGGEAQGVIVQPLVEFGGNLDEPFGKLVALYDVKEVPVREVEIQTRVRVINATTGAAGPTPEEVFAKEAPGVPPAAGEMRGRMSPLEDPRPAAADGPLGPVKVKK